MLFMKQMFEPGETVHIEKRTRRIMRESEKQYKIKEVDVFTLVRAT